MFKKQVVDLCIYVLLYWLLCLIVVLMLSYAPNSTINLFQLYPWSTDTIHLLKPAVLQQLAIHHNDDPMQLLQHLILILNHTSTIFAMYSKQALTIIVGVTLLSNNYPGTYIYS